MTLSSSILWQNDRKTVVLLDLIRSIEEAQIPSGQLAANNGRPSATLRRLISALPPASPFPTPEPKTGGSELPATSPSAQIAELMTQGAVESALEEIKASHDGPWCLPRITSSKQEPEELAQDPSSNYSNAPSPPLSPSPPLPQPQPQPQPAPSSTSSDRNTHPTSFDLIVLDPPWPNRSAKRKRKRAGAYRPVADLASVRALLRHVPVASRLAPGGLVAVWVTNAARFADLLLGSGNGRGDRGGGVFAEWDVELVGEWTWLKVTVGGEPVVPVDSAWRKPWERLLIGRKRGPAAAAGDGKVRIGAVERKVVVAAPDVHSRKPNLRGLFEELLPERYEALEVFARNLTAGWWAWGDQVLLFQRRECWVEESGGDDEVNTTCS
ncbi:MT-A70-domain-containing protein [Corynascus novoguineensis]|uniref:MT-A70-domain-containing protein n=1 Tax=Corynascus novoguineensis TaxID=1126955 RepID=A0AAN7HUG0_9PEZI|nr:MT-A70-domain-containing protein [Corynascus novoguineensis]